MLAYLGAGIVLLGVVVGFVGWWLGKRDLWDYRADALLRAAQACSVIGGALCFVYLVARYG